MNALKYLLLALVLIAAYSCDKDDNDVSEPNFSVLGISTVTINNVTYNVNDGILLKTADSKKKFRDGKNGP